MVDGLSRDTRYPSLPYGGGRGDSVVEEGVTSRTEKGEWRWIWVTGYVFWDFERIGRC